LLEYGVKRPLVVVTRPKAQSRALISALRKEGLKALAIPTIRIAAPRSYRKLDASLRLLAGFDAAVFASRNAVEGFFKRAAGMDLPRPKRLYAVGVETARALAQQGWPRARTPKTHRAEELARVMGPVRGLNILLPRAAAGREALPTLLRRKGARVAVVDVYRTVLENASRKPLKRAAKKGIAAVAFSSGSTVEQFIALLGPKRTRKLFKTAKAVSIGPVTSAALERRGIAPAAQARTATAAELARAVLRSLGR
jgi:uroporphyrinogen III methyltransferase/synthase